LFRSEPSPGTNFFSSARGYFYCPGREVTFSFPAGLLNSVRRSNLDRYIVNLKQKAREGAGKRAVSATTPSKKPAHKVIHFYLVLIHASFHFLWLARLLILIVQRSRAEEEGKWDAVSKAIQKVLLLVFFFFLIVSLSCPHSDCS
jgi:hypothetical protein